VYRLLAASSEASFTFAAALEVAIQAPAETAVAEARAAPAWVPSVLAAVRE